MMKRIKGFMVALSLSIALVSVCSVPAYCEESSESGETIQTISPDSGEDITNQDGSTDPEETGETEENGYLEGQENSAQLFFMPGVPSDGH